MHEDDSIACYVRVSTVGQNEVGLRKLMYLTYLT